MFKWLYEHIQGNCLKKDLDFESVLTQNFTFQDLQTLFSLLDSTQITQLNGKDLIQLKVDNSPLPLTQLAEKLGFLAPALSDQDVEDAITAVMSEQAQVVQKILKTGKEGPIMALVG